MEGVKLFRDFLKPAEFWRYPSNAFIFLTDITTLYKFLYSTMHESEGKIRFQNSQGPFNSQVICIMYFSYDIIHQIFRYQYSSCACGDVNRQGQLLAPMDELLVTGLQPTSFQPLY